MSKVRSRFSKINYPAHLEAMWAKHLQPREPDAPTVISTFAGCGGSSLGYSMAGYRELLAVEYDKNAVETFRLNFLDVPVYHGDITTLSVDECLRLAGVQPYELDVFDGSPPCQGFSTAGKRMLDDERNQLFRQYVRLLDGLKPKVFVMENVSGMVKGKMKLLFAEILRTLRVSGYRVSARLLNAQYFHVPQSRERIVFIGVREDLGVEPTHPKAESNPVTVRQALVGCAKGLNQESFSGERKKVAEQIKSWRDDSTVTKGMSFNLKRLAWDRPSRTILKQVGRPNSLFGGGLLHPRETRHLSISELARLGSFCDEFKFTGRYEQQWERIGNSVPPLMMEAIARHIYRKILV